ncbi:hypothetical protein A6770_07915 [Nostoc minutum NIES-26]|uniref:Uncharacterized protein n=1 Tax=Nostoc minutum NIES-26 TaxID=1844469 RepID=A0A367S2F2_9NOSO|nr:hypothetical protein A6770_07915 [Nostoc minutum NIES-26]
MTIIQGNFRVIKAAPDGDSIRFYPNNSQFWDKLLPTRVITNRAGGAQLRLDSIDALETHFNPRGDSIGVQHQPLKLAHSAAILPKLFRRLLGYLAINDGSMSLDKFPDYLDSLGDRLIILPDGHVTGFDFVVKVEGQNIKLTSQPEDLVFLEK